jgi:hypothetical protein
LFLHLRSGRGLSSARPKISLEICHSMVLFPPTTTILGRSTYHERS